MRYKDIADFKDSLKGIVDIKDSRVNVTDASKFKNQLIDRLIFNAVFNENNEVKGNCRWLIINRTEPWCQTCLHSGAL